MLIKTILNSIENHRGFVYDSVSWDDKLEVKTLLVQALPRMGSKGYCSGCGKRRPTYDTMKPRRFQFVPLWSIMVFLVHS